MVPWFPPLEPQDQPAIIQPSTLPRSAWIGVIGHVLLSNTGKKPKLKWGSASSAANSQAELAILPAILGCIQHLILAPVAPYPSPSIGAVDYRSTTVHAVAAYCRGSRVFWLAPFMSSTNLIGLMYSTVQRGLHGPSPPCPCPACAPCTDRQTGPGTAQGSRAGRPRVQVRLLSLSRDLLWVPNLISLATRLPYLFLSYTVHEEQASQKRTDRKLQHHLSFTFVCRLAAISRDPARIPLVCSPKQSISTCPPGCCTATKQPPPFTPHWRDPELLAQLVRGYMPPSPSPPACAPPCPPLRASSELR